MRRRIINSLALFCSIGFFFAQPQSLRDSLNQLCLRGHDTSKVLALNKISRLLVSNQPDSALMLADSALAIATRIRYKTGIAQAYFGIGSAQTTAGRYDEGIKNLLSAIAIFETLNNRRAVTNMYNSIGNAYVGLKNNGKAFEFFMKSYRMACQPPADEYMIAIASVGVGGALLEDKKFEEAIGYFKKAEGYFGKSNNPVYEAMTSSMIGETYFRAGNSNAAEKYFRRLIPVFRQSNDDYALASVLGNLGELELERKNYQQATVFLSEALALNVNRKAWDNIQSMALKLSETMERQNKPADALKYYKIYVQYKDSVITVARNKAVAEAESKYQSEKKEQELRMKNMELKTSQMQVSLRSRLLCVFAGAIVLALVLLFFVFKQYGEKKRANLLLIAKNKEVEKQNFIIEEKNKDITDSINYARHIQHAIIPPAEKLKNTFRDAFVIFKPKDIVSGDFYSLEHQNGCIYLAVVDCTGHGVPGAMLSVFASSSLKTIIATGKFEDNPAGILSELCSYFRSHLNTAHEAITISDGADMALCIWHPQQNKLYFAGAKNGLYRVRSGQMNEFSANRYGISGANAAAQTQYTNHTILPEPGDKFYLFTDGFADQFGGPKGKKFKQARLENLLLTGSGQPMTQQGPQIDRAFEEWKGRLEQLDDVTLVGLEIG